MNDIEIIFDLISRFGFPIVMVVWFMVRTEKVIKSNTKAFEQMADRYDLYKLKNKGDD